MSAVGYTVMESFIRHRWTGSSFVHRVVSLNPQHNILLIYRYTERMLSIDIEDTIYI